MFFCRLMSESRHYSGHFCQKDEHHKVIDNDAVVKAMEKKNLSRISKQLSATVANQEGTCIKVTAVDTNSKVLCIQCDIRQRTS